MRATGRVFGLCGVVAYNKWLSAWTYRRVFFLAGAVYFAANLLDFCWVSRWNRAVGVDDRAFLLGLEVVQPIVGMIASIHLPFLQSLPS